MNTTKMKQQYEVRYLVVTRTTPLSCPTEFILFITKVTLYLGFLGQILHLPSKLGKFKLKLGVKFEFDSEVRS